MRTWMIGLVTAGVLVVSAGTAVGRNGARVAERARPALKREGGNFLGCVLPTCPAGCTSIR